ncbi:MAG: CHAD domain-containing protein, partial [Acidimicrobiales bacterium]
MVAGADAMDTASFSHPDTNPAAVRAALATAGFEVTEPRPLRRTLLDTFDGRLNAAGLRLELQEAKGFELALAEAGAGTARVSVTGPPRFAGDLPVGPVRARLAPLLEIRALLPVMTVTGARSAALQRDRAGKVRVTAAVYEQLGVEGRSGTGPAWVVEVGELAGYPKEAGRTCALLEKLKLRRHATDVLDLLAAGAGVDLRGFPGSPAVALDVGEPALDGVRRVLDHLAATMEANWQGTVDELDAEFLHDLRVAVRRSRSVLAESKWVLASAVRDRYREGFGWLGTATGPARDLDVSVIEWDNYV